MSGASRIRLSERDEECLTCYLMACDAALLYLQELDKVCIYHNKTPFINIIKLSILLL